MESRFLGSSGLKVSIFALGTMGFGGDTIDTPVAQTGVDQAKRLIRIALDAGVNLFDTANVYVQGRSEEVLGAALGSDRDRVLVSTKMHSRTGDGPNDIGQSRWNIIRACEASLRRLGTDHIDIYHVHRYDGCTPLEESLGALDHLVSTGKVRYIACSNYTAWQLVAAAAESQRLGISRYVAIQSYYSLLARELEWDILPACDYTGTGVIVWSPLTGGLLSGKFDRDHQQAEGSRRTAFGFLPGGEPDPETAWRVIDACREVADGRGVTVAQVALNWIRSRAQISSIIIGARNEEQLTDNLGAAQWELSAAEIAALDRVSDVAVPYPHWFNRKWNTDRMAR